MSKVGSPRSPTEADARTGQALRMARISARRSQEWLAQELGVSAQQVGKYERGENRLSGGRLQAAMRVLNISPGTLLTADEAVGGFAEPDAPGYDAGGTGPDERIRQALASLREEFDRFESAVTDALRR